MFDLFKGMASKKPRVCVIGCGPSGMSVLYHFSQMAPKDMPDIVCYEKQPTWGGLWNLTWRTGTDEYGEPVHSSLYDNLWINIPKEVMEYPDYTFQQFCGRAVPSYTPASFIRKYIEARMIHGTSPDLKQYIRFSTVVRGVKYDKTKDEFTVSAHDLVKDTDLPEEKFTHVVVANGIFSTPNVPYFPGLEQFKGRILHSHDYRQSQEFKGDRILVIGDSYSAQDLALQTLKFGAAKVICSWGTQPMTLRWPKGIEERPLVEKFDKNIAYFKDGSSAEVDVVLFCTGYQLHFPFLSDDLRLKSELSYYPDNLYKGIVWMKGGNGKLLYIGVQNQRYTFPMFEAQAFWICKYITGGVMFPSRQNMLKDTELWRKRCSQIKTVPDDIEFQAGYITDICGMAGFPWRLADARGMYNEWDRHRFTDIGKFRDHQFASLYTGTMASSLDTSWMQIYDDRDTIFSSDRHTPDEADLSSYGAKLGEKEMLSPTPYAPDEVDTSSRGAKVGGKQIVSPTPYTPDEVDTSSHGAKVGGKQIVSPTPYTPDEVDTSSHGTKVGEKEMLSPKPKTPGEVDTSSHGVKVEEKEILSPTPYTPDEADMSLHDAKVGEKEKLSPTPYTPDEADTSSYGAKVGEKQKVSPTPKPKTSDEVDPSSLGAKAVEKQMLSTTPKPKTSDEVDPNLLGAKVGEKQKLSPTPKPKTSDEVDPSSLGAKVGEKQKLSPTPKPKTSDEVDPSSHGAKVGEKQKLSPTPKPKTSDEVDTSSHGAKVGDKQKLSATPKPKTSDEVDTSSRGAKVGGKQKLSSRPL